MRIILLTVLLGSGTAFGAERFCGLADPSAIVQTGQARFTVLTPTLLRLEFAEDETFEDRPSLWAVQRRQAVPTFEQQIVGGWQVIETQRLKLRYRLGSGRFGPDNLSIELIDLDQPIHWRPGLPNKGNLGGTVRTLDSCVGPLDLGEGVLSRDGWYLLDDSGTVVFSDGAEPWPTLRRQGDQLDWYFFGYGLDYARALGDLVAAGGPIPLPPRYVFGSWYSRYWPYSAEQFLEIADGYKQHGYPLDVMVIDMDWHREGWTGYSWNHELIPDPPGLLNALHERHLKTTLNLHPHDGVGSHENAYAAFAQAMGVDAASQEPIPFDITDPQYAQNYFKLLHHPLEAQGVDFWWIDWQQQKTSNIEGLDPLFLLNHLHFQDKGRPGSGTRGLTFSRWGGWGNHRYPIQFSGDTEASWRVLEFLVPFTSTAGNVGAAYWSHDIGGHFSSSGRVDPELYARWLWFGAFSATMRVHSTRDSQNDRRPWLYGQEFEQAAHAAYDLRYRLLPYIYSMARVTHDTGMPLNRPMYLHHADQPFAYRTPNQFYFGDDMIVAPAIEAGKGPAKIVEVPIELPAGTWFDLLTNRAYEGPAKLIIATPLDRTPLLVRGGTPIPMQPTGLLSAQSPIDELVVRVYPGPDDQFVLYQDDGLSPDYLSADGFARTMISQASSRGGLSLDLTVQASLGEFEGMLSKRTLMIEACSVPPPSQVLLDGEPLPRIAAGQTASGWWYDPVMLTTTIRLPDRPVAQDTTLRIEQTAQGLAALAERREALAWRTQLADVLSQSPDNPGLSGQLEEFTQLMANIDADGVGQSAGRLSMFASQVGPRLIEELIASDSPGDSIALETLLGADLQVTISNDGNDRFEVSGQLRLTQLPAGVTADIRMTLHGLSQDGLGEVEQVATVTSSKTAQSIFDLPANGLLFETRTGRLSATFDWQGLPVTLERKATWDNTYVRSWWVVGPFDHGLDIASTSLLPVEQSKLGRSYLGVGGAQVSWQRIDAIGSDGLGGLVDLRKIFDGDNRCAFAQAFLLSDMATEIQMTIRHDDGAAVWANGQRVYLLDEPRPISAPAGVFPVTLKAGGNRIMVKVGQYGGDWGFNLKISPSGDTPLPSIRGTFEEPR